MLPDYLDDRAQDGWEPLLAIAELAGPQWGERARGAAMELHGVRSSDESLGVLLLEHVHNIFGGEDRITTDDLPHALVERDDGPWAGWWARDVEDGRPRGPAARLARLLKPFDVSPGVIKIGDKAHRGYLRSHFDHSWERYLQPPSPAVTTKERNEVTPQVSTLIEPVTAEPKTHSEQAGYEVTSSGRNGVGEPSLEEQARLVADWNQLQRERSR